MVGHRIQLPKEMWITKDELVNDEYFKNHKLVRKNMQGVNGWTISFEDYQRLLFLLVNKGFNIKELPALKDPSQQFMFEKDKGELIGGRGLAVFGYIKNGTVQAGEIVLLCGEDFQLEMTIDEIINKEYMSLSDTTSADDYVGLVFKQLSRRDLRRITYIKK